ncbi:hypothetical protein E5S67_01089 [Microcoleus sp. IPMA8]|uniref:Uncharacterized protein n=1 Tax=Microcoleus asticus IPMA8 TaxID=2563858 RepID=A0ABX2CSJ8_9CYAN|nr:hypothetical protein [Microcoleus asticus IPMA8]
MSELGVFLAEYGYYVSVVLLAPIIAYKIAKMTTV